jgi:hypothetical protein
MKKHPGLLLLTIGLFGSLISPAVAQTVNTISNTAQVSANQLDAIDLLKTVARSLRSESDSLGAGRLQARIADELWELDQDFALQTFRWSFESVSKPVSSELSKPEQSIYLNRQAVAVKDVLRLLGAKDSKRAEAWLKELETDKRADARESAASTQSRLELFSQIALELAPTAPDQASRLGLASLSGSDIPEGFPRLLFAMANVDRQLSDQLFRAAISTLRRGGFVSTTPLIALSNYLFSPGGELVPSARLNDAQLLSNYFIDAAWQQPGGPTVSSATASLYNLLETRGLPIVAKYSAERLPELRGQMTRIGSALTPEQTQQFNLLKNIQQQQNTIATRNNYDLEEQIARAEREKDPQVRDTLLNSIVHVLMRQDIDKARTLSSKIGDASLRSLAEDDLTLMKVQQNLFARSYEEARKTATQFNNALLRAKVLIQLAAKSTQPMELLAEALTAVAKSPESSSKTVVLLSAVEQYARFDSVRAFETLAAAVNCLNRSKNEKAAPSVTSKPPPLRIKTYTVINGQELTAENETSPDSIDFSQVKSLVSTDYLQLKFFATRIEQPLQRGSFLVAVAGSLLREEKTH